MKDERLAELYRMFGAAIYARCRRILGDPSLAEDAMQDVFLKLASHLDRAPNGREALTWIYRIATNHCLSLLRSVRMRNTSTMESIDAPGPHPEAGIIARRLVEQLLVRVSPKLSSVAWLHWVDGLDQSEVARVLALSRRTVVSRLAEFRSLAKSEIEGEFP